MVSDPRFPLTFDDLRQATSAQRQAIYRRIINTPDVVRELVRAMTASEADRVIDALDTAAGRLRSRPAEASPSTNDELRRFSALNN